MFLKSVFAGLLVLNLAAAATLNLHNKLEDASKALSDAGHAVAHGIQEALNKTSSHLHVYLKTEGLPGKDKEKEMNDIGERMKQQVKRANPSAAVEALSGLGSKLDQALKNLPKHLHAPKTEA